VHTGQQQQQQQQQQVGDTVGSHIIAAHTDFHNLYTCFLSQPTSQ
jgi:hypothetical protein